MAEKNSNIFRLAREKGLRASGDKSIGENREIKEKNKRILRHQFTVASFADTLANLSDLPGGQRERLVYPPNSSLQPLCWQQLKTIS